MNIDKIKQRIEEAQNFAVYLKEHGVKATAHPEDIFVPYIDFVVTFTDYFDNKYTVEFLNDDSYMLNLERPQMIIPFSGISFSSDNTRLILHDYDSRICAIIILK